MPDQNLDRWSLRAVEGNAARLGFPLGSADRVRVTIDRATTGLSSDIQVNYEGLAVKARQCYAIRFRARANQARCVVVGVAHACEPWSGLGILQAVKLTPEWQYVELIFEAPADAANARMHFDVGGNDILLELSDVALQPLPIETKRWTLRTIEGNAARLEFPLGSADRVRVTIDRATTGLPSAIQLNYGGLAVKARQCYAIRFRARADRARDAVVGVAHARQPWSGLGILQTVKLTSGWQYFEIIFEASADATEVHIHFDLASHDIPIELADLKLSRQTFRIGDRPTLSYLICTTPRCGSNFLSQALWCQNKAGRPQEYFLYWYAQAHEPENLKDGVVRAWILPTDVYAKKVIREGTTPNGVFGFKLMWHHVDVVINRLRTIPPYQALQAWEVFSSLFPNLHYIYIIRQDKVRQAVSLAKAMQSGEWYKADNQQMADAELSSRGISRIDFHSKAQMVQPVYDFDQISSCYQMLLDQEGSWEAYFAAAGITPYRVVYEELVETYEQTVQGVLEHLQIPRPYRLDRQQIGLKRQHDDINEVWTRRFMEEMERRYACSALAASHV